MVLAARVGFSILCIFIAQVPAGAESMAQVGVRQHAEKASSDATDCPSLPNPWEYFKPMPQRFSTPQRCKPVKQHRIGKPVKNVDMCACKKLCFDQPLCRYAVCKRNKKGNKCTKCYALHTCKQSDRKSDKKNKFPSFFRMYGVWSGVSRTWEPSLSEPCYTEYSLISRDAAYQVYGSVCWEGTRVDDYPSHAGFDKAKECEDKCLPDGLNTDMNIPCKACVAGTSESDYCAEHETEPGC